MTSLTSMKIAIEWFDAYRSGRVDQMVDLYSPDALIDCACGGNEAIYREEGISNYWQQQFIQIPALELLDLQIDEEAVVVTYRTSGGVVETLLDIADDGLITCCACGPV